MPKTFKAAIITASDSRAAGAGRDISGQVIRETLESAGYSVIAGRLLADDEEAIYQELIRLADEEGADLILTTGGTGLSERDRTPEATLRAATRNVPGIAEAVRSYSMTITRRAMLSRAVSVMRNQTLIINLPGSPKAVKETLEFLLPELEHGLLIMLGLAGECGQSK